MAVADLSGLGRTVGLIAASAVGVPAAILAYHRQRALDTSNGNAADQHNHKVMADNREHQTGIERHLRDRYTTCAEQLGNENPAIRLAGVYALASLADDWHGFGNDSERQVCIDLLCGYLRAQRRPAASEHSGPHSTNQSEQVRRAIFDSIRARTASIDGPWVECHFDLSGADLTGLDLSFTCLNGANLANADLNGARLSGVRLIRANLTGARLVGAKLDDAELAGADLTRANLTRAQLDTADLTLANLKMADLTEAELNFTNLTEANLNGTVLTGANLSNARLNGADLNGSTLASATLSGADLSPTSETVESDPNLAELRSWRQMKRLISSKSIAALDRNATILASANLTKAVLNGVNLTNADLSAANLSGADLTGADLTGADLTNADLSAANLTGTNLSNATMTGADTTGAAWTDEH